MNQEEGLLGSSNRVLEGSILLVELLLDKDTELCQQLNLVQLQYQELVEGCIPAKVTKHIKLIVFQAESKVLTKSTSHPSTYNASLYLSLDGQ